MDISSEDSHAGGTYRIEGSEHDVDPTGGGDTLEARRPERREADVEPEEGQEGHRLLQHVADRPVPREYWLVDDVVVPPELSIVWRTEEQKVTNGVGNEVREK